MTRNEFETIKSNIVTLAEHIKMTGEIPKTFGVRKYSDKEFQRVYVAGVSMGINIVLHTLSVAYEHTQRAEAQSKIISEVKPMLINLWVRDKIHGRIHQVGTEVHDSVEYLDGEVVYVNMQNSASTLDDYEWVSPPDTDDYISVTPDELKVNRELIHKDLLKMLETKRRMENGV